MEEEGEDRIGWGTWEELVLGGAVIRHGCQDWEAVASEVQARTFYPFLFTPQVCRAKYEALQERYSGCSAWFEELRKRRVEELRRALEISDDSIGSLESKLEYLKTEKGMCLKAGYSSSQLESPVVILKTGGNECSSKEASKDGSSTGSFTQEIQKTWSQEGETGADASAEENEKKHVSLEPCRLERFPSIDELAETLLSEHGVSIKGRRGKRRRKDLSKDVKEECVPKSNLISLVDIRTTSQVIKKLSTDSAQPIRAPDASDHNLCTSKQKTNDCRKRKRKDLKKDVKEECAPNNNLICPADVITISHDKDKLANDSGLSIRAHDACDRGLCTGKQRTNEFIKRKKKDLRKIVKEASSRESNLVPSAHIKVKLQCKKLASDSGKHFKLPNANEQKQCTSKQETDDFTKILDIILENEHASVFRRRLDSQVRPKRARYRGIVRRHMDLDTIRSRIANNTIKSTVELLRDLLLIANNALVFYSKITREYRCALVLRDLVTKRLHHHEKAIFVKVAAAETPKSPVLKPPAKPRSVRPFNRKFGNKEAYPETRIVLAPKEGKHAPSNVSSPSSAESSALTKRSPERKGKVARTKHGNAGIQAETPMKVRYRAKV